MCACEGCGATPREGMTMCHFCSRVCFSVTQHYLAPTGFARSLLGLFVWRIHHVRDVLVRHRIAPVPPCLAMVNGDDQAFFRAMTEKHDRENALLAESYAMDRQFVEVTRAR